MSRSNIELTKQAYLDFSNGYVDRVMDEFIANDVEWIVPGRSTVSGVYRGKHAVREYWDTLARKNHRTSPVRFLSDENVVVVLTLHDQDGDAPNLCTDILTFQDGQVVRFESTLDTASLERVFGLAGE